MTTPAVSRQRAVAAAIGRLATIVVVAVVIVVALMIRASAGASLSGAPAAVTVPSGPLFQGVKFEAPLAAAKVDQAVAITAAGGTQPDAIAFVLLTNPNVGPGLNAAIPDGGLIRRPVYVLQFNNVPIVPIGPEAGGQATTQTGTTQVYVDADTGLVLYTASFGQ